MLQVGSAYQAPDFHTRALQHSRPQLTWDADEPGRAQGLARKVNAEQLRDDDFKVGLLVGAPCKVWQIL